MGKKTRNTGNGKKNRGRVHEEQQGQKRQTPPIQAGDAQNGNEEQVTPKRPKLGDKTGGNRETKKNEKRKRRPRKKKKEKNCGNPENKNEQKNERNGEKESGRASEERAGKEKSTCPTGCSVKFV